MRRYSSQTIQRGSQDKIKNQKKATMERSGGVKSNPGLVRVILKSWKGRCGYLRVGCWKANPIGMVAPDDACDPEKRNEEPSTNNRSGL